MKTSMTKFLFLCGLALLMLQACKKDGVQVVAGTTTPGALTATSTTLVLSSASLTDATQIMGFSFTQPTYGYAAAVTNTLQIDAANDNWVNPYTVALTANVLKQGFNTADFNNILLKLGLAGGVSGKVNVRIMSSIGTSVAPTYSNVVALTVTPFNLTSWLYVVGNFNGYSTSTPDSLISPTGNGIYSGIINFTTSGYRFLLLPAKNYNNKYATVTSPPGGTATTLTYATQYVTGGGNDLYVPSTPGNYLIIINTKTNSITVAPANTYSVIGSSTPGGNYSTDLDLTKYVNDGATGWTGTIPMTAGAFKIRQNHDWTYSWGVPQSGSENFGVTNGLNDTKNDNIPVAAAGTYKVTFNIPVSAVGTVPSVTATYTSIKQ